MTQSEEREENRSHPHPPGVMCPFLTRPLTGMDFCGSTQYSLLRVRETAPNWINRHASWD